jgi:hypothetical protein
MRDAISNLSLLDEAPDRFLALISHLPEFDSVPPFHPPHHDSKCINNRSGDW